MRLDGDWITDAKEISIRRSKEEIEWPVWCKRGIGNYCLHMKGTDHVA